MYRLARKRTMAQKRVEENASVSFSRPRACIGL